MGWFLRKSFRVGPLRLNLSKRGIGTSVGIKGARLGVDAGRLHGRLLRAAETQGP